MEQLTTSHILLIECADQKGLIAAITQIAFIRRLNIVVMKEYVEPRSQRFFARFELTGDPDAADFVADLRIALPEGAIIRLNPKKDKDIVLLVTKEQHCLSDLLVRRYFAELSANIKAVIGNYDRLKKFTEKMDVPFILVSHENKTREQFEEELIEAITKFSPDLLILAKFMRILSPAFVEQFKHRIINIHHSFLPAFIGANPYKKAFDRGVKLIGATAHIVTNDLDEGPIITQQVIDVDHEYDVQGMIAAGHEVEKTVLAEAVKLMLEDRVFVAGNKTIIFD